MRFPILETIYDGVETILSLLVFYSLYTDLLSKVFKEKVVKYDLKQKKKSFIENLSLLENSKYQKKEFQS
jgi:hypothetical protein